MSYDIAESNQRQSDFLWGWQDREEARAPRSSSEAYMRGYRAAASILRGYSDASHGE